MDEGGRSNHPWLGKNELADGASANCKADLDEFLYRVALQYFKTVYGAIKTAFPNHLVFGPAPIMVTTRAGDALRAEGQFVDVVQGGVEPIYSNQISRAYQLSGKPIFLWTTLTSQRSSSANRGAPWGSGTDTGDYDYSSQRLRGIAYSRVFQQYWKTTGNDGIAPVLGLDWWEWTDKTTGGEDMNFGLVTNLDNAYDGVEDASTPGKDNWGFATGGESHNYGDFLTPVIQSNRNVCEQMKFEMQNSTPQAASTPTIPKAH